MLSIVENMTDNLKERLWAVTNIYANNYLV